jgi:hypothetical protein
MRHGLRGIGRLVHWAERANQPLSNAFTVRAKEATGYVVDSGIEQSLSLQAAPNVSGCVHTFLEATVRLSNATA